FLNYKFKKYISHLSNQKIDISFGIQMKGHIPNFILYKETFQWSNLFLEAELKEKHKTSTHQENWIAIVAKINRMDPESFLVKHSTASGDQHMTFLFIKREGEILTNVVIERCTMQIMSVYMLRLTNVVI
ncbi:hypothetical protein ACJX0J_014652, partial [Zea mays]